MKSKVYSWTSKGWILCVCLCAFARTHARGILASVQFALFLSSCLLYKDVKTEI
jgi:hypothetical protein